MVGAKQPVYWFLGGKGLGIQQENHKIEGLLPLFWGPALHIPFKIFFNPSKRKG